MSGWRSYVLVTRARRVRTLTLAAGARSDAHPAGARRPWGAPPAGRASGRDRLRAAEEPGCGRDFPTRLKSRPADGWGPLSGTEQAPHSGARVATPWPQRPSSVRLSVSRRQSRGHCVLGIWAALKAALSVERKSLSPATARGPKTQPVSRPQARSPTHAAQSRPRSQDSARASGDSVKVTGLPREGAVRRKQTHITQISKRMQHRHYSVP